jgi:3-oxo-5alpha-steroid 4-dehydrogenase
MFKRFGQWYRQLKSGRPEVAPARQAGEDQHWDIVTDVAVVGFGGAGAAAALEARAEGAQVAAIDRFNGGGSTKISGGIYYAGGGTSIQDEAGIEDSPDNMFNYLVQETGDAVCRDTLRQFCRDSPANLAWLQDQGVPFEASLCPFKTSYPSNDYYLYYSGNESFPPYSDTATPAPRGHRAHGRGVSGAALFGPLQNAAIEAGVEVLPQHRASGLITGPQGEVFGVQLTCMQPGSLSRWLHRWLYSLMIYLRYGAMYVPLINWVLRAWLESLERHFGQQLSLRARRGVIISSGGFFYNRDMVEKYARDFLPGMPLGTIGDDGSGILLGESVGGRLGHMDNVSQWRFINPPESFVRGVMIDHQGRRVCNEMLYGAQMAEQIMDKSGGHAWLIIDAGLRKQALREIGPSRAMWFQSATALVYLFLARKKAPTLEQLAVKLDIPAADLVATIAQYNRAQLDGQDDAMGKPAEHRAILEAGPWYALDCRIDGAVRNPSITLGGLCVDEESGEVLARRGGRVKGLYAAGRSAVGIASHSYVSGLSIAGCIFSGRRAGRHAARRESN